MVLKLNIPIIDIEIKSCNVVNSSPRHYFAINLVQYNKQTIDVAIKMLDSQVYYTYAPRCLLTFTQLFMINCVCLLAFPFARAHCVRTS